MSTDHLRQREALDYAISRGLMSNSDVLEHGVTVVDASRRNRNFEVRLGDGSGWFLKQGLTGTTSQTVARQAAVEKHLRTSAGSVLSTALVPYIEYNSELNVLVSSLLKDAVPVSVHHRRIGRRPTWIGKDLAYALAELHSCVADGLPFDDGEPPWVLGVHLPTVEGLSTMSGAGLALARLIQAERHIGETLDHLRSTWEPTAVVHNDLKWDNILVYRNLERSLSVGIIDWELAGVGDPTWDVASVIASYLMEWVRSVPLRVDSPLDSLAEVPRVPVDTLTPAQVMFIESYLHRLLLCGRQTDRARFLERSIQMAGARILLYAVESSLHQRELNGEVVLMVQLASNVLRSPHDALRYLVGIAR